jgi:ABC-type multidrug transport system ATPase subunit
MEPSHPAATPLLRVERLTKRYGRTTALEDVSLSVRRGEVLGLIGPNGAGKTTLFECLGGVLPYDRGEVWLDGSPDAPLARKTHLFYLPDGIEPWSPQRLRWVLKFTVGYFGGGTNTLVDVVRELDLDALLDSPIGTLSKGQRKRALLAIGLLTPQPLLLADEPFDGLDLRQTREVAQILRRRAAAGRTLFLSIHQIADAARVCDRFVLLSGGRICGEGTYGELASRLPESPRALSLEEVFLALT